jgi:uncharacterized cupin superfamily protein
MPKKIHVDSIKAVTDSGEEILRAGDCAGFKANVPDGHHLQNRSTKDAVFLEVGSRCPKDDEVTYPASISRYSRAATDMCTGTKSRTSSNPMP